ncbi:DUF2125 domain-containing protein [Loktanella sp. TSTF-M6]|uniref:DUF2125 domain-containing protein n=1 Tax=Loktanella gaetbuli TaxID=2881335 RepID=A0ABS8BXN1_9RHOB|nr:DUF2125 domain-containing protein [Loktanella gaetbuli]MCB5200339.1 DUF2125 domain-containing protein [Loktanella gaetbuli]
MKALLVVVLALSALYSGYWFIATQGLNSGLDSAMSAAETRGWDIDAETLDKSGFPSRFDVTATNVAVRSPSDFVEWRAPVVQTAALSYRPNSVIATLPPEQTLRLGQQVLAIGSENLRANVKVAASPSLAFEALTAEAATLNIRSDAGWQATTGAALIAMRAAGPAANTYEGYVSLANIMPVLPLAGLPDTAAQMTADITAVLDRPLDRTTPTQPPLLETLTISEIDLSWGSLRLGGTGEVTVDAGGYPDGRILLQVANWRDMLALANGAGVVPPNLLPALTSGLRMLSGGSDNLQLPLTFAGGDMMLGPLPLGPAPRLR